MAETIVMALSIARREFTCLRPFGAFHAEMRESTVLGFTEIEDTVIGGQD
jgi:hypothetical protein